MENLLLDPGKMSEEKGKIVESAVANYHRQVYHPPTEEGTIISKDISDFAGFWIRDSPEGEVVEGPKMLASTQFLKPAESIVIEEPSEEESESSEDDQVTEPYNIEDLFTEGSSSLPKLPKDQSQN